ncbi:MAG: hypothetical protein WAS23_10870 [Dokdonella sp.]|nr:hypothetical protein [Dokdonella sp.]HOX72336.1 hypothetical protein [Dokdonella sp.]HPG93019.1 hypothetical protein [Dokdonella sp.]HPN78789.1 hypothetical protein [Dokdonella sp.]
MILAVGIGANVLVFHLVDGILVRALPYRDDSQRVYIPGQHLEGGLDR